jgi:LAO/AO transport system kinase
MACWPVSGVAGQGHHADRIDAGRSPAAGAAGADRTAAAHRQRDAHRHLRRAGAGKSTFIEALGVWLIEQGKKLAVLAVDPSSSVTGGSILGDKTRMELLCQREEAFIRPSPSAGSLGGVAEKTREAMLVCEAAGFDVIIIETVGVGQSETTVAGMTDMFCLLQLPNAGDDLQAIKKGIVEIADLVVINKADIDKQATAVVRAQWRNALHMLRPASPNWTPPVIAVGVAQGRHRRFWEQVEKYQPR